MNEPDRKRLGLERLGLERLGRKAGFWVVTAIVSGVVAFMGNFVPDNWTTVPGIAVVIWVPAMFFAYYSWRKFGLESRKLRALELSKLPITSPDSHRTTNESLAATSVEQGQSAQSDQPPVLYLRSFDKDQTTAKLKGTGYGRRTFDATAHAHRTCDRNWPARRETAASRRPTTICQRR
jgi:hypothetical protein